MIVINKINKQSGMSLIETLIAVFLFSITMLALVSYQKTLIESQQYQYNYLQAERIAFQLLDIYPHQEPSLLLPSWQSQTNILKYEGNCKKIQIIITPNIGKVAEQVRWICS